MENECEKYEALFIFGDEQKLNEHLEECPQCRAFHQKMQKVSALVKEAKPQFRSDKQRAFALRTACASFLLVFTFWGIGLTGNFVNMGLMTASNSNDILYESVIHNEWGFPVDEYGLLMAYE